MALGTLHPRQVLGGSSPLLSPAFRRSHFRRHVPLRPQRRKRSQQRNVGLWAKKMSGSNCLNSDFHLNLGIFYMPQIYDMGSTALLPLRRKACWGFFRPKNPTVSAGFEPANLGTKGQHATSRPPKPLKWLHLIMNAPGLGDCEEERRLYYEGVLISS